MDQHTSSMDPIWQQLLTRVQGGDLRTKGSIEFTPQTLADVRHKSGPANGVPCTDMIIGQKLWCEIAVDSVWASYLDLVTSQRVSETGHVASLFGMRVWSPVFNTSHPDTEQLRQLPDLIFRDSEGKLYCYRVKDRSRPFNVNDVTVSVGGTKFESLLDYNHNRHLQYAFELPPVFQQLLDRVDDEEIMTESGGPFSIRNLMQCMSRAVDPRTGEGVTDVIFSPDMYMELKADPDYMNLVYDPTKEHTPIAAGHIGALFKANLWSISHLNQTDARVRFMTNLPSIIFKGSNKWHFLSMLPTRSRQLPDYSDQRLLQILIDRCPPHWENYLRYLKQAQHHIGAPQ